MSISLSVIYIRTLIGSSRLLVGDEGFVYYIIITSVSDAEHAAVNMLNSCEKSGPEEVLDVVGLS